MRGIKVEHIVRGGIEYKRCGTCGEWRSIDEFSRASSAWDGLQGRCKSCKNRLIHAWRQDNPELAHEDRVRRYREHPERSLAATRRWREAHPEQDRERQARWRAENPGAAAAATKRWQKANPERVQANKARWNAENHDQIREQRRYYLAEHAEDIRKANNRRYAEHPETVIARVQRRRARKLAAPGHGYTTPALIAARCEMWGWRCYLCGAPMQAIDHVIPLAKGGAHWPANLRPICKRCNSRKKDRWPYDIKTTWRDEDTSPAPVVTEEEMPW